MLACSAEHRSVCRVSAIAFLSLFTLFFTTSTACSNGNCQVFLFSPLSSSTILFLLFKICALSKFSQVLEACSAATDCGTGLYCGNCPALGKTQPFCVRGQATIPTSIVSFFFFFFGYGFKLNCMNLLSFIYGLCEFGGGFEL